MHVDLGVLVVTVAAGLIVAALAALAGAVWGHHEKLGTKVSYHDCSEKRKNCPCVKDIDEIKDQLKGKRG